MPVETKKLLRIYAIMGAVIIVAVAAMVVLILYLGSLEQTPEPEPSTETTVMTQPPTEPTLPQSAFAPEDFTPEGEFLSCLAAETMVGIDVSHHQKQIDWEKVKASGVEFVMVRLGYRTLNGEELCEDRFVQQNLQGARDAGLLVGAYFYSQAITVEEAQAEAAYALQILGDFRLDLPLAYDWEQEKRTENVDVQTVTDCALAFCQAVTAAGHETMVYFNSYQAKNLMDLHQLTQYPWWLAMYDSADGFPCRFDMWQYTCTGAVPGIEGNVDVNVMMVE